MSRPGIVINRATRKSPLSEVSLDHFQILPQPIDLTHMTLDRLSFILGYVLSGEPDPTLPPEQVRRRISWDQMGMEDRLNDVLQPCALPDNLIAPRYTCRRSACVTSPAIHTSGRKPLA
jgi:hypothetical protein